MFLNKLLQFNSKLPYIQCVTEEKLHLKNYKHVVITLQLELNVIRRGFGRKLSFCRRDFWSEVGTSASVSKTEQHATSLNKLSPFVAELNLYVDTKWSTPQSKLAKKQYKLRKVKEQFFQYSGFSFKQSKARSYKFYKFIRYVGSNPHLTKTKTIRIEVIGKAIILEKYNDNDNGGNLDNLDLDYDSNISYVIFTYWWYESIYCADLIIGGCYNCWFSKFVSLLGTKKRVVFVVWVVSGYKPTGNLNSDETI